MDKKLASFLFFLILLSTRTFGQGWYLTRGLATDEVAWAVDVDSSGNVYWAVEEKDQWPYWYYNIVLFKIDSNGQELWQSNSWDNGTGFNDIAFKATVKAPYVYLSGRADSTGSPTSGDALVTRYRMSNGSFDWAYQYNSNPDYGYEEIDGLVVQPEGIYLSGWKQQQNTNDMDFLIQKIDTSGQLVWTNSWDYNGLGKFDGANGHMVMDDHFIFVAGTVNRTNIASPDGNLGLACFNRSDGAYQWDITWGGPLYDDALGMTMSADSQLYITGYTANFGNGSQNYLNKYTRTGTLLWSRIWGGPGTEDARSLVAEGDSLIYVVGSTSSFGNGLKDIFVLKYDSAGTLIDSLFWGGAYDETAKDVARYGDYLYITGETKSFGNGQVFGDHKTDGLLLKINARTMQAPDSTMTEMIRPQAEEKINIELFPNPSDGKFRLSVFRLELTGDCKLNVFDCLGRWVAGEPTLGENQFLDYGFLPTGLYFLQIVKDDRVLAFEKVIIEK